MKNKTCSLLIAALGMGLSAVASAAYPTSDYWLCTWKGETTLEIAGGAGGLAKCWLSLAAKIPCDNSNEAYVVAAGSVGAPFAPGASASCSGIHLGDFPWRIADLTQAWTSTGADIEVGVGGSTYGVLVAGGTAVAGGVLPGLRGNTPQTHTCANGANPITLPQIITVDKEFFSLSAPGTISFETAGLNKLSCQYIN